MTRFARVLAAALAAGALLAAPAGAATRFTIRGAGFGHGVGMSQYGAMGMAAQGWGHRRILAHYYTGTDLGVLRRERVVRVLLQSTGGTAAFTGATAAAGRILNPARTYTVRPRAGGLVQLVGPRGNGAGDGRAAAARDGPRLAWSCAAWPATAARTAPTAARSSSARARSAASTPSTPWASRTTSRASCRSSRPPRGRSRR